MNAKPTQIVIDWSTIDNESQFYDAVFEQSGAPSWHGRNLDAINDSWVEGDICTGGPPFAFVIRGRDATSPRLREMVAAIDDIAYESVAENGGSINGP